MKVDLHHFSKIKSAKEVTKQQESRFFLLCLLADRRNRIRSREAQKHVDPVDPDPEHCLIGTVDSLGSGHGEVGTEGIS